MKPGIYEQLLTIALQQDLEHLADPRLFMLAPVDPEESHTAITQFLEHLLARGLSLFRGADAATLRQRMVDRILGTLTEELGADWADRLNLSTPLRRLLAVHSMPRDTSIRSSTPGWVSTWTPLRDLAPAASPLATESRRAFGSRPSAPGTSYQVTVNASRPLVRV